MVEIKIKILVKELKPDDRVLGLKVIDAQPRENGYTRVELNGVSLPMESDGDIIVTRAVRPEAVGGGDG